MSSFSHTVTSPRYFRVQPTVGNFFDKPASVEEEEQEVGTASYLDLLLRPIWMNSYLSPSEDASGID